MIKLLRKFDVKINQKRRKETLRIFEHDDFELLFFTVGDQGKTAKKLEWSNY